MVYECSFEDIINFKLHTATSITMNTLGKQVQLSIISQFHLNRCKEGENPCLDLVRMQEKYTLCTAEDTSVIFPGYDIEHV